MRKDLPLNSYPFAMPVMIVASYSPDDIPNAMVVTWGGISTKYLDKIVLNIDAFHRTAKNIRSRMAFTISVPDSEHWKAVDYLGSVSGDDIPDKLVKCCLHSVKSRYVDAPVITDFPVSIECRVEDICIHDMMRITGRIINVSGEEGRITDFLLYEHSSNSYMSSGHVLGHAEKFSRS